MGKRAELTGQKFGRLTVIKEVEPSYTPKGAKRRMWLCRCECGSTKIVTGGHLLDKHVISCGCYNKEHNLGKVKNIKHNQCGTRIYRIYRGMLDRCYNSNIPKFKDYGGRGITVCDKWRNDFQTFYNWAMANGYADDLTIDRIDVNGNYKPSNCRWATAEQQANNKTNNLFYIIDSEKLTLKQISKKYNVEYKKLFARVKYLGWSIYQAIGQ